MERSEIERRLAREIAARERAESRLGEIFSVVNHRLRTPLASLLGITDLLLEQEYPAEKQRYFLTTLNAETRRLTDFLSDFLDLQALETGRSPYDLQPVSLEDLLRDAFELFAGRAPEHPFRLEVTAGLGAVRGDYDRLLQALNQLIENAVDYSPEGTAVVLSLRRENDLAVISVTDRGIGIAEADRERVFERFFRARDLPEQVPGAGLGLTIAARIVGDHGGEIRVESEPGTGSTFSIVLPLRPGEPLARP